MMPRFLARLFARVRRPVDNRVFKLDDPEQDGPAWHSDPLLGDQSRETIAHRLGRESLRRHLEDLRAEMRQ